MPTPADAPYKLAQRVQRPARFVVTPEMFIEAARRSRPQGAHFPARWWPALAPLTRMERKLFG